MLFVLFVVAVLFPMPSFAEITKIVIDKREPFAASHEFGVSGAYEKLIGKAYGEIDPKKHHNKNIINLKNAPINNRSRVEYSIDILILKPIDMQRGNQALRVNFGAERSNNPTTLAHAGDGFMRTLTRPERIVVAIQYVVVAIFLIAAVSAFWLL